MLPDLSRLTGESYDLNDLELEDDGFDGLFQVETPGSEEATARNNQRKVHLLRCFGN